jgi:putative aldouronate transport system substrate-binding protein
MVKRLVILAIVLTLAFSTLSGCGEVKPVVSDPNSVIKVSIGGSLLSTLNTDDFGKWIGNKTKVKFRVINMEGNDALRLMAATNDLPDMVGGFLGSTEFYNFANMGLIKDIPESLLDKYPLCKADTENNKVMGSMRKTLGKIYGIPIPVGDSKLTKVTTNYIYYRDDWAKKVGITKAPETVNDMYNMFKDFTTKDPDGNGLNDTYGLSGWLWQIHLIPWVDTYGWVKEDGKWIPGYISNAMLEGIKYWNRCFNEGVLDPEFSVANSNPADLFFSNKIGVMYTHGGMYWGNYMFNTFMEKNGITDFNKAKDMIKILAPGPKKDANSPSYWPYGSDTYAVLLGSSVDDVKMDRILSLLNFLKSDEARMARRWGFKGIDYKMVNNKPVSLMPKTNGIPKPIWEKYPCLNIMYFANNDGDWEFSPDNPLYSKETKQLITDATAKYADTTYPEAVNINYLPTEERMKFNYNLVQMETDISKIVSAKPEDVEKKFNEFKQNLYNTYDLQNVIDSVNTKAKSLGVD